MFDEHVKNNMGGIGGLLDNLSDDLTKKTGDELSSLMDSVAKSSENGLDSVIESTQEKITDLKNNITIKNTFTALKKVSEIFQKLDKKTGAVIMPALIGLFNLIIGNNKDNDNDDLFSTEETKKNKKVSINTIESEENLELNKNKIKSNDAEKNDNNITMCSKTARKNLAKLIPKKAYLFFNENQISEAIQTYNKYLKNDPSRYLIPRSNANLVEKFYKQNDKIEKYYGDNKTLEKQMKNNKSDVFDVIVKSKSNYGHRAVAFKNKKDNKIYILDPYRKIDNKTTTKPIPFLKYSKNNKINFVVPMKNGVDKKELVA